jgi:hypothetical protein
MRDANPRQEELLTRMRSIYIRQRIFGALSVFAVLMHYPLIALAPTEPLMVVGFVILLPLAIILHVGVQGLVAGTADHRVRRAVRRSTGVAWILAALAPISALVALFSPNTQGRPALFVFIALGVAVLVIYFRKTRTYWTHVQSVA